MGSHTQAGEAAPARLPADLPDFREFPPGVAIPGKSREFPTPEISLRVPGNWPTTSIGRRRANFDSDCDSEGFMCTGSSARASGLRKLQFALYILDTRVRAVVENLERQPPADALLAARDGPAPRREALALVLALRRVQVWRRLGDNPRRKDRRRGLSPRRLSLIHI